MKKYSLCFYYGMSRKRYNGLNARTPYYYPDNDPRPTSGKGW
jgi:hypothetical protein